MRRVTPGERIVIKREIAGLLAPQEWGDIDLVLSEHDLPISDNWSSGDRYGYVISMLSQAPDETLRLLHTFVTTGVTPALSASSPWRPGELRLFMSHLATHQAFVGEAAEYLAGYGVSAFVAHVSIEPSDEWRSVIEEALLTCDAMAVYLHDGFKASDWCDQEVGFALARRVPVLPLNIELNPHGFMAKLQAAYCVGLDARQVGEKVLEWLVRTPSAQTALTEGLVKAWEQVNSYASACRTYDLLGNMRSLTPAQLQRIDAAARSNNQISGAHYPGPSGEPLTFYVGRFIKERGGTPEPEPDAWSDEPPF